MVSKRKAGKSRGHFVTNKSKKDLTHEHESEHNEETNVKQISAEREEEIQKLLIDLPEPVLKGFDDDDNDDDDDDDAEKDDNKAQDRNLRENRRVEARDEEASQILEKVVTMARKKKPDPHWVSLNKYITKKEQVQQVKAAFDAEMKKLEEERQRALMLADAKTRSAAVEELMSIANDPFDDVKKRR